MKSINSGSELEKEVVCANGDGGFSWIGEDDGSWTMIFGGVEVEIGSKVGMIESVKIGVDICW